MRYTVAGDIEFVEVGTDVFGNPAEVFGDDFCLSHRVEDGAQTEIAVVAVDGLVFVGVIGVAEPAR